MNDRITTTAPDFSETCYPSRGEKIGPAWRAVWDELHLIDEATGADLADLMCDLTGITRATALGLLTEACAAGWIYSRRSSRYATRATTSYRLTWAARRLERGTDAVDAAQSLQDATAGTGTPGSSVCGSSADRGTGNRYGSAHA